jgi:hypothetical protein
MSGQKIFIILSVIRPNVAAPKGESQRRALSSTSSSVARRLLKPDRSIRRRRFSKNIFNFSWESSSPGKFRHDDRNRNGEVPEVWTGQKKF